MVTAQVVIAFGFTPGNAHGCDQCTLKSLVLMRQQHATAKPVHSTAIRGVITEIEFRINDRTLPLANVPFPVRLEWLCQRLEQSGGRALAAASTCDCDCEFSTAWQTDFAGQSDVAPLGLMKFPIHLKIVHQILPAVAGADVAYGPAREIGAAGHDQMDSLAMSVDDFGGANFRTRP